MELIWWYRHHIGITLTANMRSRMMERGSGGDSTKPGRWTWVCIGGKDVIPTVFVSTYHLWKNINGLNTECNQQARYFKQEEDIEVPDVHALFIRGLCKFPEIFKMRGIMWSLV